MCSNEQKIGSFNTTQRAHFMLSGPFPAIQYARRRREVDREEFDPSEA